METKRKTAAAAAVLAGLAVGAGVALLWRENARRDAHPSDSAPGRTARRSRFGGYRVVGRTVTINKPRTELFAYWRNFTNLPRFIENIESVRTEGDRSVWTVSAPAGRSVDVITRIVDERDNELIAWRAAPESDIDTEGRVTFRDAPGGRGTEVAAVIAYRPPGGEIGRLAAKLFQREPAIQARRELKRFKMLMETGEIATPYNRNDA